MSCSRPCHPPGSTSPRDFQFLLSHPAGVARAFGPARLPYLPNGSSMHKLVRDFIYAPGVSNVSVEQGNLIDGMDRLLEQAFDNGDPAARLEVQRTLYVINLAHLATPWQGSPVNVHHPLIATLKYRIEQRWEAAERATYQSTLADLPSVDDFPEWVSRLVASHHSNELHPIFQYLRDDASLAEMTEFFRQETPLEMLFGDILAFMLPGVYGSIKMECVQNYWDEVGHAEDARVHRNMRADLMKALGMRADNYVVDSDPLVLEELELVNMYLSLAMNRPALTQLIGIMLATELMIPGRFEYQIAGWKRLGMSDTQLAYHLEHVTVDAEHAYAWLHHVVMPILREDASVMADMVLGVNRRLDAAARVSDRLYAHIRTVAADAQPA
ncbi:iron-containing redox enzyme family protein [Burkholderia stagnalis]|nr:iron-containing redox enzyme family protein [Burkholderia stagnalis]RQX99964.1 iron-containing redox enzyme family protein [Burkholderia stagnalis]RQY14605.1 iron-containing redox enzyme family protein [Burkholderia stagnalis]RQY29459.1 iron-containing redox enzyme family protein [Burkholderia stagnalis]